jgi:hypothetical protein
MGDARPAHAMMDDHAALDGMEGVVWQSFK